MKKYLSFLLIFHLAACSPNEEDFKTSVPETPVVQENLESSSKEAGEGEFRDEGSGDGDTKDAEINDIQEDESQEEKEQIELEIPAQINHTVPFFSQAPDGDWAQPWQDACEEASLILAHYGMKGETLSKEEFKKLALEMVDWQVEEFGYYESTTVDQVVQLYENFFDDAFKVKVIDNPTVEEMKEELAQGHLIVGPFAGRELGNPFYSGEGPYYHMMVIKGYDETHFITNDVGTKRGENFIYPYQTILDAMHDYKEPGIESQPPKVIVLYD